ncbi:DUF4864 domain-containing protein [Roseovarius phycicola]|uniref:DUF4864 domain-containing protein n=1 Tax=Roseovarius phycicola TaxID=3080976 RepID=A0ABZ2HNR3_9RHOB
MPRWMMHLSLVVAITLSLALAATKPAHADDAARQVISDQLTAFQQDDFATAFTFASPMIKGMFGTSERFGEMVRNGYPMVWRPSEVEFLDTRDVGGALVQDVLIRDADGVYYELEYEMIAGEDGWKINGVRVRRAGEGTA